MTLQEHKDHLASLEQCLRNDPPGQAILKPEGSFYFGADLSLDEHIERYRAEVNKLEEVS
jgi:hypothetical protein